MKIPRNNVELKKLLELSNTVQTIDGFEYKNTLKYQLSIQRVNERL